MPRILLRAASSVVVADAADILQLEVEAGGVAELEGGRRREGDHLSGGDLRRQLLEHPHGDRLHAVGLAGPLRPVLQGCEAEAGVLAEADEAEAGGGEEAGDVRLLVDQEVMTHLGHHLLGLFGGRAGGHGDLGEEEALVLVRQEAAGQGEEQQRHDRR